MLDGHNKPINSSSPCVPESKHLGAQGHTRPGDMGVVLTQVFLVMVPKMWWVSWMCLLHHQEDDDGLPSSSPLQSSFGAMPSGLGLRGHHQRPSPQSSLSHQLPDQHPVCYFDVHHVCCRIHAEDTVLYACMDILT